MQSTHMYQIAENSDEVFVVVEAVVRGYKVTRTSKLSQCGIADWWMGRIQLLLILLLSPCKINSFDHCGVAIVAIMASCTITEFMRIDSSGVGDGRVYINM